MGVLLNKITGELWTSFGKMSDYVDNDDYISNPTPKEIEQYTAPTLEEVKALKVRDISNKAISIIDSIYKQRDKDAMLARITEFQDTLIEGKTLTVDEEAEKAQYKTAWEWIKNIRKQEEIKIAEVDKLTTVEAVNNYPVIFTR